jgi:hypothetical protein
MLSGGGDKETDPPTDSVAAVGRPPPTFPELFQFAGFCRKPLRAQADL